MREIKYELNNSKKRIELLKGIELSLSENKGRNKYNYYDGKITEIYPSVFVITDTNNEKHTYSYHDVITKTIKFFKRKEVI